MLEIWSETSTERVTYFVEVVLPLSITGTYTYRVPVDLVSGIAYWETSSRSVWKE